MITLLLIVTCLISLAIGATRQLERPEAGWVCSTAATSLSVGVVLQGLLGLAMASAGLGGFPLLPIISLSSIAFFSIGKNRKRLAWFAIAIAKKIASLGDSQVKGAGVLIAVLGAIALTISVGPVNHPDAADYHAGYPYLYWQTGKLVVDGGLHQGLIGLGDFAYIPFFQENSTWIIRSVQGLCVPIVVANLLRKGTSKWFIVAFLSSPVLLQWLTTAKPLFLGEACLAISYLYWKEKQSAASASMCVACIFAAISFKISAIIIAVPIIYDLVSYWIKQHSVKLQLNLPHLIVSAGGLAAIILHRFLITGNPLYPLFSRFFSTNNVQHITFESMLRSYGRDSFFPVSLIIPDSLGEIGMTFGPALGLLLIFIVLQQLWLRKFQSPQWTAVFQIALLLIVGQGRADYYACPVLLLLSGEQFKSHTILQNAGTIIKFNSTRASYFLKFTFLPLLAVQLVLFFTLSGVSFYQSVAAWQDYENSMKQYAYGYHFSEIINGRATPPVADLRHRNTRLYYKTPYIDSDRFKSCLGSEELAASDLQFIACMKTLNIKTLAVEKGILYRNERFSCKVETAMSGSRNPFNRVEEEFDLCNLRPTSRMID